MISVEGGFVRTECTGEDEFGIKRGNNGVLAGLDCSWLASATGWQTTVSSVVWPHCFCGSSGWWMQCGYPPVRILFWYYIKSRRRCGSFLHGVPDRIRTCNRQNRNLKLYPIALQAHKENFGCVLSFASVCFLNCRSRFKNFRQNYRLKFSKNNSPRRKNIFVVS